MNLTMEERRIERDDVGKQSVGWLVGLLVFLSTVSTGHARFNFCLNRFIQQAKINSESTKYKTQIFLFF